MAFLRAALPAKAVALHARQPGSARRTLHKAAAATIRQFRRNLRDLDWAVWILCDVDDEGANLRELGAGDRSDAVGPWAVSNPSFAVWLLMHKERVSRHERREEFAREAAAAGLLSGKTYKDLVPEGLQGRCGVASERAAVLRRRHAGNGTRFPKDNPSSNVDRMLLDLVSMYNRTAQGKAAPVALETLY